jgi:hypothetical protein
MWEKCNSRAGYSLDAEIAKSKDGRGGPSQTTRQEVRSASVIKEHRILSNQDMPVIGSFIGTVVERHQKIDCMKMKDELGKMESFQGSRKEEGSSLAITIRIF